MKNVNIIKSIGLSLVTIALLSSNAHAGKIITDADVNNIVVTPDKQFGFGGWNFDNVDVRIVDLEDFSTALPGTLFNTTTGDYTTMGVNQSFEAEIKNAEGEVMGHLHGKDWPVGEPAGIKIINDDTQVKHGKPFNCIMTSSYQEFQVPDDNTTGSGYLDAFAEDNMPNPVLCSSGWQTHKRYKINFLPSTVTELDGERYGKPVDLVFNLDPTDTNTTVRRYQVLQKANNYTGMRLDGYKVEVFDANGEKNPALTLSLGEGEGDKGGDIWDINDMANYSHGLWGPYEEGRFDNGFFDYVRVYYPVALSDNNQTISYTGDLQGGNYQSLFGNWLPSIWEPEGIFHDDDQNPATDGVLKAFLGVAPGHTERAWYKSTVVDVDPTDNIDPVYTWVPATIADLTTWSGEWYERGPVEDVLNLGLNYIINVGENAAIGNTFTLRITPHVDTNQTPPSSYVAPVVGVENDFNQDGVPDILFSSTVDGQMKGWEMKAGISILFPSSIGDLGSADWEVVNPAIDIDGDTKLDILLQNSVTGDIQALKMNGFHVESTNVLATPGTEWKVVGADDIDGDGDKDIIIQNSTDGSLQAIKTKTGLLYDASALVANPGASWEAVAVTDVDGDGIADVVLQDSIKGYVKALKLAADFSSTSHWVGNPGASWKAVAVTDVDGDGIADVVLQDSIKGYVKALKLDSAFLGTSKWVGNLGATWKVMAVTDVDGDSIADVVLQDSIKGYVKAFKLDSAFMGTSKWVGSPGASWSVKRVQDMDGDGIADVVLQDSIKGYVKAFKLDSAFLGTSQWVGNPGAGTSTWEVE